MINQRWPSLDMTDFPLDMWLAPGSAAEAAGVGRNNYAVANALRRVPSHRPLLIRGEATKS
jgi:hypothetical protein